MAYISQELKAKIAPTVKAVLKKYKLKGSLSINNHSTLVLTVKSGKIDFITNFNNVATGQADPAVRQSASHIQINPYHFQDHFSGNAKSCLIEIMDAMKGNTWFDKSDIMTDYFNIAYYIYINIGCWNKPYTVA